MTKPKDPVADGIREIAIKQKVPEGLVAGLFQELATVKDAPGGQKFSQQQIADRYGIAFGQVTSMRCMGKAIINEIRDGMINKALAIANTAQDAVMDRLNNPVMLAEVKTSDLARIAGTFTKQAADLQGGGAQGDKLTITIGEVSALKAVLDRLQQRTPLEDRLREAGKLKVVGETGEVTEDES